MKECEFLKQPHLQETFEIDMHDALYRGQTSPIHLFKDVFNKKDAKIFYIDFNSLYPFIQHKNPFPINHPKVLTNKEECLKELIRPTKPTSSDEDGMGFAKCRILPPKKLFIPTLPFRLNRKLLFPLCAKEKQAEECKHKDKQRSIKGTWCIIEISQAIKDGYKIQHVTQLLIYSQQEKIFTNFVAKFHMLKQKQICKEII